MANSPGPSVLVLCEGGKDEEMFLRKYFAALCPEEESRVVFVHAGCTIYQVLETLKEAEMDGGADLVSLLRLKKGILSEEEASKLARMEYEETYFVFDADLHRRGRRAKDCYKDAEALLSLSKTYGNETEGGLLLVNYPMLESAVAYIKKEPIKPVLRRNMKSFKESHPCSLANEDIPREAWIEAKEMAANTYRTMTGKEMKPGWTSFLAEAEVEKFMEEDSVLPFPCVLFYLDVRKGVL